MYSKSSFARSTTQSKIAHLDREDSSELRMKAIQVKRYHTATFSTEYDNLTKTPRPV
jgi:hypothetical protein